MSSSPPHPSSTPASSSPFSSSTVLANVNPAVATALTNVMENLLKESINKGSSSKRTSTDVDDEDKENSGRDDSYMSYGRQYARSGDIFASIDDVIQFGVARAISDSDDEREQTAVETQREESWELLCSRIPNFRSEMVALADQRKLRRRVARKIGEGVHNVRAEDASSLKNMILDYLLMDTTAQLDPQIKRKGKKADRGFQHRVTAALLCPLKYEATQQTYSDILAGKKCLTAYDLPRFLYPDGHAYNPDDMDTGVLHGHLLLRVAKHIFQGPTAALERPGYHRGRRGNAALMGMTAMTPRAIAYIAIQARFAISAVDTWAPVEGNFDYNAFFWVIVSLFDDGEGEDIIKLYNEHVFGTPSTTENPVAEADPPAESDIARLKAQRAAKRARLDLNVA